MPQTINMLAAGVATDFEYVARSGNVYTSDSLGFIKSVLPPDAIDLIGQGCIPLGQSGGLSNFGALVNPTVSNDNTQDYAVGSRWVNKVNGIEFIATSVATGAAVWIAINASALPWVTGQFYGFPRGVTPVSFLTVLGTMYAYPVFIPNNVTLSTLNINSLTGQAGGKLRVALYQDNGAGYPGALVAGTDSGDLAATATAVATKSAVATKLAAGWYWVASQATASSTMPSVAAITNAYTNELGNVLGFDTAAHALAVSGEAPSGLAVTGQTYGAMPATFPTGATLVLGATSVPLVALGV